jgi:uncharacterized protein involved in exopolysaccharide biosynthesis
MTTPAGSSSASAPHAGDDVHMFDVLAGILARWRRVAYITVAATATAVVVSLLLPKRYTANARFVPETSSASLPFPGQLAGIASQLGINLPSAGQSPAFYSDIVQSRTLADEILRSRFPNPRAPELGDSVTLLALLRPKGDNGRERLENGRRNFTRDLDVALDRETGIVTVSVTTPYPALSAAVANQLVAMVAQFDVATRRSTARDTREFIEQRLPEAEGELRAAEDSLQRFLERNREFKGSPQLEFAYGRLQRHVDLKQQILTTLRQNYEQARIQEVNDTPVLTVVDTAVVPVKRSSPRRTIIVAVTLFTALFASLGGASVATVFATVRASDPERAQLLERKWHSFLGDAGRLLVFRGRR